METNAIQKQLSGHNGAIYDVCWDYFRQEWLTAGGDGVVAAWNESNGRALLSSEHAFFSIQCIVSGPVAGTEKGELMMFDAHGTPRKVAAHDRGIFALSPIGPSQFYCGGGDARITRWDSEILCGEWHWKNARKIRTIVPSTQGVLVGSSSGKGLILNKLTASNDLNNGLEINGHEGGLYAAVFMPIKSVWLTGGRDGHLRVWSTLGKELLAIPAHEAAIYRILLHDGKIYTASRDKTVKRWNAEDLAFEFKWDHTNGGAKRSVNALGIGGNENNWLLAAGDDRLIRLMQLNSHP